MESQPMATNNHDIIRQFPSTAAMDAGWNSIQHQCLSGEMFCSKELHIQHVLFYAKKPFHETHSQTSFGVSKWRWKIQDLTL